MSTPFFISDSDRILLRAYLQRFPNLPVEDARALQALEIQTAYRQRLQIQQKIKTEIIQQRYRSLPSLR